MKVKASCRIAMLKKPLSQCLIAAKYLHNATEISSK